jgi:hypothetical protein
MKDWNKHLEIQDNPNQQEKHNHDIFIDNKHFSYSTKGLVLGLQITTHGYRTQVTANSQKKPSETLQIRQPPPQPKIQIIYGICTILTYLSAHTTARSVANSNLSTSKDTKQSTQVHHQHPLERICLFKNTPRTM